MSDETEAAVFKIRLAALEKRVEDMEERYDGHIRNVVKAIVLAACLVLWKPFSDFWQALNK